MAYYIQVAVVICLLLTATVSLRIAPMPKDGDVLHACVGSDAVMPWSFSLSDGQQVLSIEWLLNGTQLLAFFLYDSFVAVEPFRSRLQGRTVANGSLVLSQVTARDTGTYSIVVTVNTSTGESITERRTAVLEISDSFQVINDQLHVIQDVDAVWNETTQQWLLVLSCGQLTGGDQPAFPVEWMTPSGRVLESSAFSNGYYHLHLAYPVQAGTYLCRVPGQYLTSSCLHGDHDLAGQASVTVDRVQAKVIVMEAELRAVKVKTQQLKQELDLVSSINREASADRASLEVAMNSIRTAVNQDLTRLDNHLHTTSSNLTREIQDLEVRLTDRLDTDRHQCRQAVDTLGSDLHQQIASVSGQTHTLDIACQAINTSLQQISQDIETRDVSFNAQATRKQDVRAPHHVKFDYVLNNRGKGFDASSGEFTAPVSGTYAFHLHYESIYGQTGDSIMMADGVQICTAFSHDDVNGELAACPAVVHLTRGQRVWVQPRSVSHYQYFTTSFTGFLVHKDIE